MSESSSVEVRETSGQKTWLGIDYLVERTDQKLVYVCQHHLQMVLRGSIYYKTPIQYSALRAALIPSPSRLRDYIAPVRRAEHFPATSAGQDRRDITSPVMRAVLAI